LPESFVAVLSASEALVMILEAEIEFVFSRLTVTVKIDEQLNEVATIRAASIKKAI
jgi:hypothetical protein